MGQQANMTEERKLESAIHHHLMRGLIDNGFAPDIARLQRCGGAALGTPESLHPMRPQS
jgi:hypothetical protein